MIVELLKDIVEFTKSDTRKSSGNTAHNRKLLEIQVKSLKNTCYGVNFAKVAEKAPTILL